MANSPAAFEGYAKRNLPGLWLGVRTRRLGTLLRDIEHRLPVTFQRHRDLGHTRVIQETIEHWCDIPPGYNADGRLEITGRSVAPSVFLEIELHPCAKFLLADPALEHFDYSGAFFVRDVVECVGYVVVALDGLPYRARGCQIIFAHGADARIHHSDIQPPGGLPNTGNLALHPGGKRFVQPRVVPPGRRHQVPEPLMCHFVRAKPGQLALVIDGFTGRVG